MIAKAACAIFCVASCQHGSLKLTHSNDFLLVPVLNMAARKNTWTDQ